MKNLLFLLMTILVLSVVTTHAQESLVVGEAPTVTRVLGSKIEMNIDSISFAVTPEGTGLVTMTEDIGPMVILFKTESGVIAVMGTPTDDETSMPKGIIVSTDGNTVFINATDVIIKRPVFSSHAEADLVLKPNQEYWLLGDRNVYHKIAQ